MNKYKIDIIKLVNESKLEYGDKGRDEIVSHYPNQHFDGKKMLCPFHEEDTPSFIWNNEKSFFKCFGCGRVFSIIDLYKLQGQSFIESTNTLLFNLDKEALKIEDDHKGKFKNYVFPTDELNLTRDKVETYLKKRKISKDTMDFCKIKEDVQGNIVFEHRDINNKLLCTKYRPSAPVKKGQSKMWWQKNADNCPILYGINWIDITKPLIIVEGHIDALAVIESGCDNVVSIPHGANDLNWIEFNYNWLENFNKIILWFDDDSVGKKAVEEVTLRLGEERIYELNIPISYKEEILKAVKKEDKLDANNVLYTFGKQVVFDLIHNAKEIPISDVIDLFTAEDFDPAKEESITTGWKSVDKFIFGHYNNTISIWTGKTGDGKSTAVLESVIIPSMEQGINSFLFSGELNAGQLKNWITLPLAGNKHIVKRYNGDDKPITYSVTKSAKNAIEKYYLGRVFVYGNDALDTSPTSIIKKMETLYKKRGTKIFVIDNLMIIDFSESKDIYEGQTKFMINLIKFQRKYGVAIHVVAHPNKNANFQEITEYDILGSSNIPNLVHRIFVIKRLNDKDKVDENNPFNDCDLVIRILKDRLLGVQHKNIGANYDPSSRRMYTKMDNLNKTYSWEAEFEKVYNKDEKENIVYYNTVEDEKIFGEVYE